jgi:hypothetical protein
MVAWANFEIDEADPEKDPMQFTREGDHFSEYVLHNQRARSPEGKSEGYEVYRADLWSGRLEGEVVYPQWQRERRQVLGST